MNLNVVDVINFVSFGILMLLNVTSENISPLQKIINAILLICAYFDK